MVTAQFPDQVHLPLSLSCACVGGRGVFSTKPVCSSMCNCLSDACGTQLAVGLSRPLTFLSNPEPQCPSTEEKTHPQFPMPPPLQCLTRQSALCLHGSGLGCAVEDLRSGVDSDPAWGASPRRGCARSCSAAGHPLPDALVGG